MLLRAFAKINLDLRVGGKRADGYHEIRTVFQTVDWSDEIRMELAGSFEFAATGAPNDESNLVVRAVHAFELASGKRVGARIRLTKNIPAGAGLGGGSADAAVTIIGLQALFDFELKTEALWAALRSLGADVPFFAVGGCAVGVGRGDEVYPLDDHAVAADYVLVLVVPSVSILTKDAYSWLTVPERSNRIEGFCAQFLSNCEHTARCNDFEPVVFARHRELLEIRDNLLKAGAFHAAMSGSGSVMFGQFRTHGEAIAAAANLSTRYSTRIVNPIGRADYFSRMIEL